MLFIKFNLQDQFYYVLTKHHKLQLLFNFNVYKDGRCCVPVIEV